MKRSVEIRWVWRVIPPRLVYLTVGFPVTVSTRCDLPDFMFMRMGLWNV